MGNPKSATQRLAREYADQGDPNGWFEEFYARACGDIGKVYWADLKPNPLLLDWLKERGASDGMRAITIGCGLGDDAEALSRYRFRHFPVGYRHVPAALSREHRRLPGRRPVRPAFSMVARIRSGLRVQHDSDSGRLEPGSGAGRHLGPGRPRGRNRGFVP